MAAVLHYVYLIPANIRLHMERTFLLSFILFKKRDDYVCLFEQLREAMYSYCTGCKEHLLLKLNAKVRENT